MKHTKKKRLLLAVALLAGVLLLAGCGQNAKPSATQPQTQPTADSTGTSSGTNSGMSSVPDIQNGSSNASPQGTESAGEETQNGTDVPNSQTGDENTGITGTWAPVSATVDGQDAPDVAASGVSYIFDTDGSFTMAIHGQNAGVGTYTVDGSYVTCEMDGLRETFTYQGSALISEYDGGDGMVVTVYHKTDG